MSVKSVIKIPTVIFHPTLAAKLTHETIGHLAEADFILQVGANAPWLILPPLSPKITVVDYAHTAFGKPVPLPMYTDDEDTPTQDVTIIQNGLSKNIMTSLHTAAALNLPLTGNARKAEPDDTPLTRMRNTALLPGTDCPKAMLASIEDGYYLVDSEFDSSDPETGEFASKISEGYRVRGGKICEALPPCFIYGYATEFLQSIAMVGNDFVWITDTCEIKGQEITIAAGAPSIIAKLELVF